MVAVRGRRCALRLFVAGTFGLAWYGFTLLGDGRRADVEGFINPAMTTAGLVGGRPRVVLAAEPSAGAGASSTDSGGSVSLVKISETNVKTNASVLGGLAGLWVGGIWGSAIVFLLTSYVARNLDDDKADPTAKDLSKGVQGVSQASLEALNAAGYVNDKYQLTDKATEVLGGLVNKLKDNPSAKGVVDQIEDLAKNAGKVYTDLDDEIGLKDTAGSILTSLSELAELGLNKVQDLNSEYKVTATIGDKVKEVSEKIQEKAKSATSTS